MGYTNKQKTYIANANCRWNIKSGAVRSGKSFVSNNEQWKRLYHFDKKITTEEESGKKE